MKITILVLLIFKVVFLNFAQDKNEINPNNKSNIQTYTPSILLKKKQFQIDIFNNIYTQTAFRNADGNKIKLTERQTFYTGFFQFTRGISNNARFNLGFDLYIASVNYNPFDKNSVDSYTRTALSHFALRIKINPIKNRPRFSIQSALLLPIAKNLEMPRFLTHDRVSWWTQLFYDKYFNKFQLFFELDFLYRFKSRNPNNSGKNAFLRTPVSIFFSYFPSNNFTVYTFIQYSPLFRRLDPSEESTFGKTQNFTQMGFGIKYQILEKLNIEISYTNFIESVNDGAGNTFNLGFKFIN